MFGHRTPLQCVPKLIQMSTLNLVYDEFAREIKPYKRETMLTVCKSRHDMSTTTTPHQDNLTLPSFPLNPSYLDITLRHASFCPAITEGRRSDSTTG